MAGNDFEIKEKFCPKMIIFQAVTEVQASFVILPNRRTTESRSPEAVCYDFLRGIHG